MSISERAYTILSNDRNRVVIQLILTYYVEGLRDNHFSVVAAAHSFLARTQLEVAETRGML